jgi:hypothetical protein
MVLTQDKDFKKIQKITDLETDAWLQEVAD